MKNTPKEEIEARIRQLQLEMAKREIDAAIIVQMIDLFLFYRELPERPPDYPGRWGSVLSRREKLFKGSKGITFSKYQTAEKLY